jgi:hypothetical protein
MPVFLEILNMDLFRALFQAIADVIEKYPIVTPVATLIGIIFIITSAILKNSEIGMLGLAIFFGINLGILYGLYGDISGEEFFTFLFVFILVLTFGVIILQKLPLDLEIKLIITTSLGASVAPILISIRIINQIREMKS